MGRFGVSAMPVDATIVLSVTVSIWKRYSQKYSAFLYIGTFSVTLLAELVCYMLLTVLVTGG